jgi:putative ABC transport system ATP-binding protein
MTGRENIVLPLAIHNEKPQKSDAKLLGLAERLEITEVLEKFPSQMSGGEKQRVAVARALISNPSIVLADEPTGALDSKNAKSLMDKLSVVNEEERATILMVTHDPNAASFCSRILFIKDGVIFHEMRRETPGESQNDFFDRILTVLAQLGGGSDNVL